MALPGLAFQVAESSVPQPVFVELMGIVQVAVLELPAVAVLYAPLNPPL